MGVDSPHWHADCTIYHRGEVAYCREHRVEVCRCGWEVGWHHDVPAASLNEKINTAYGALLNKLIAINQHHNLTWSDREIKKQGLIDDYYARHNNHRSRTN